MTTIKNLLLALVNATLILLALCLFLLWQLSQSAEYAADRFVEGVAALAPIQTDFGEMRETITELQSSLRILASQPEALSEAAREELRAQIDRIDARLGGIETQLVQLDDMATSVVTNGIDHTADTVGGLITEYRSCTPNQEV